MNIIIQKKMRQKKAHFVDDVLHSRSITYLNADTVVVFPPIKSSGYAPAQYHFNQKSNHCLMLSCLYTVSKDFLFLIYTETDWQLVHKCDQKCRLEFVDDTGDRFHDAVWQLSGFCTLKTQRIPCSNTENCNSYFYGHFDSVTK